MLLFWRREWQPTPVLLPGESHGQRSLVGYSPLGRKKWDMTERLTHTHTHTRAHTHTHTHTHTGCSYLFFALYYFSFMLFCCFGIDHPSGYYFLVFVSYQARWKQPKLCALSFTKRKGPWGHLSPAIFQTLPRPFLIFF